MIINELTRLAETAEDSSETLNKEMKKNQSRITQHEIKNTLDGMNSGLEEAEE